MLDGTQISSVEQVSDGYSKSLSTKMPSTKVSNLESLCEEQTTGDMFDSEAERVRVCPEMAGGEERVFRQQSNGVTHSDRESHEVTHSDLKSHGNLESTWIIQTDHESNGVTHSDRESHEVTHSDLKSHGNLESTWIIQTDHESNGVTFSDVKEPHEQQTESGDLGSTEETVDQQMTTTTGPGSVTPDDTAPTVILVAENGGVHQLETGDDEIAGIKNHQNLDAETGDTRLKIQSQSHISKISDDSQVSDDPQSTCNAEHSFSELQHTHSPQVDSRVSEKSSTDSGVLSATTTLTRDSTGILSDQNESKALTSDQQPKQPFIAVLDRQSEDATAGGCGISPPMPGRSISNPAYPHMEQEINGFDRDHEDAAASNVPVPPQSRVPRSHSMDSKLRVLAANASPLGFDRYQHMRGGGSPLRGSSEDFLAR